MRRTSTRSLFLLACACGVLGCSIEWRVFHFPPRPWRERLAGDLEFRAADGTRLHGRFFAAREPTGAAVLYMHGNAQTVDDVDLAWLTDSGFHAMTFDWRGYGHSEDRQRDREGMLMDTLAAFETLRAQPGVDPARIGAAGWSMGGTFALLLAAYEPRVRAVASFGAFASWQGVAHDIIPVAPLFVILPGLDPSASIGLTRARILIVHGANDRLIPVHHGRTLAIAAADAHRNVRATFLDGFDHYGIEAARPLFIAFFRETLSGGASTAGGQVITF